MGTDLIESSKHFVRRIVNSARRAVAPSSGAPSPLSHDEAREPWHDLLPFTTHRIRLAADRYTAATGVDPEIDVRTDLVARELGNDFAGRSVVDLGCLEGGFALEFARRGAADVVGIEYREISVRRCELARDLMALGNASFVCGDLTTALPTDRSFDVIFAAGILYHLERPAETLARLRELCSGFMLLDTHVAHPDRVTHNCSGEVTLPSDTGEDYRGRWFSEFAADTPDDERDLLLWASSTNPRSFWPFEEELRRMLSDAGFGSVVAVDPGEDRPRWQVDQTNRVLYVCRP